jgi:hypothetical protein
MKTNKKPAKKAVSTVNSTADFIKIESSPEDRKQTLCKMSVAARTLAGIGIGAVFFDEGSLTPEEVAAIEKNLARVNENWGLYTSRNYNYNFTGTWKIAVAK